MIRRTVIGLARDEQHPTVEAEILDADFVVFGSGRRGAVGIGRFCSATALRLSSAPTIDAPVEVEAPLSIRRDGIAVVAGMDDERTLRIVETMPDPVVVIALVSDEGRVRAFTNGSPEQHRYLLVDLSVNEVTKVVLEPRWVGNREEAWVDVSSWHPVKRPAPKRSARSAVVVEPAPAIDPLVLVEPAPSVEPVPSVDVAVPPAPPATTAPVYADDRSGS